MGRGHTISHKTMMDLVQQGRARFLTCVGIQKRAVYLMGNNVYEQSIHFDDGIDHSDYYLCSLERAADIKHKVLTGEYP